MIEKIIKILFNFQIGLFLFNVLCYLMILNSEHFKFFLTQQNKTTQAIFDDFFMIWNFNKIITLLVLLLTVVILILNLMNILKKEKE